MNIFGSFTFEKLIKTFLPGFLLFFAACIYIDIISYVLFKNCYLFFFAKGNSVLFGAIAIPFIITFGILSNTLFFIFLTEYLVKKKHQRDFCEFYNLENNIKELLKKKYARSLDLMQDENEKEYFIKYVDINSFLLPKMDVGKIEFIRDSYWYYLEFQINIFFAILVALPAVIISWIILGIVKDVNIIYLIFFSLIILTVSFLVCKVLLIAARMNYDYLKKYNFSLILGNYYFTKKPAQN